MSAGNPSTPSNTPPVENTRFIRWQKAALDQLGYALNLILTFTVATIGYWFALLRDKDFSPGSSAKCAMLISLSALSLSGILGLACVVNRLWDFRGTASIARNHPRKPSKEWLDRLGRLTWCLFYLQLGTFVLGIAALAMALLQTWGGKLA